MIKNYNKIEIYKLDQSYLKLIEEFCKSCKRYGYQNNSSIDLMKFGGEYDLGEIPRFWGAMINNRLISVSGCHHWKTEDDISNMMRCLFRSATLPEYQNIVSGLSKNHMNSLPFSAMLPYQIDAGLSEGVKHFYITTSNSDHDASGKMKRTHKVMQLLEKNSIVKYAGDEIFYSTPQTKWEINVENYLEALRSFHKKRCELNIDLSENYYRIIEFGFSGSWEGYCTPLPG
jgi:hypothetical protein